MDLCTIANRDYLVTLFSSFWEIDLLPTTSSCAVITKLKGHFVRYGMPKQLVLDDGPQFSAVEVCCRVQDKASHIITKPSEV